MAFIPISLDSRVSTNSGAIHLGIHHAFNISFHAISLLTT